MDIDYFNCQYTATANLDGQNCQELIHSHFEDSKDNLQPLLYKAIKEVVCEALGDKANAVGKIFLRDRCDHYSVLCLKNQDYRDNLSTLIQNILSEYLRCVDGLDQIQIWVDKHKTQHYIVEDSSRIAAAIVNFLNRPEENRLLLNRTMLTDFPGIFGCSPFTHRLKQLNCSQNFLKSLPDGLDQCPLESLDCSHNQLTFVPKTLAQCSSLQMLNVSYNADIRLPEEVMALMQNDKSRKFFYEGTSIEDHKFADGESIYDRAFKNFPKQEMWRLFIDKDQQHRGENAFDEREPNYKVGMLRGFLFVKESIGQVCDANYLNSLRSSCINGVYQDKNMTKEFMHGFNGSKYGIEDRNISAEALQEWESERLIYCSELNPQHAKSEYLSIKIGNSIQSSSCLPGGYEPVIDRVNFLFKTYYTSLANAQNSHQKLQAIARLCRALEVYHVFQDGNQRTIVFALLTKLLIENNPFPAILDDPYIFDGYHSVDELVEKIERGMDNFKTYLVE